MTSRNITDLKKGPSVPVTHFVDGSVYTDTDIFKDEKNFIFNKNWQFVCHESEVASPYDFRTLTYLGKPILIQRGGDGIVRSFLNVCSHRGAKIIHEVSGNSKRHSCFYHLWTYDDKGACIGIPREEGYTNVGLSKSEYGLCSIKTEIILGLVFISLNEEVMPLKDYIHVALSPFEKTLDNEDIEVFHYNRAIIKSNWKAWQETNLDLYHEWMHVLLRKTQINAAKMHEREVKSYDFGHTSAGGLKASYDNYDGMEKRESGMVLPGLQASDFFFVDIFPNTALLARGTAIRIDTVTPIDEKTALVEWRGLGMKTDSPEVRMTRWQHHNQYWGPFGRNVPEDAFAAEAVDEGFRSNAALHQIIAREEGGAAQDDGMLRAWYAEWSRLVGRLAANPLNDKNKF